jgi:predicted transcriptional regulator of viral defense system
MQKTFLRILEEGLAQENRRVLSDWRAAILLRRSDEQLKKNTLGYAQLSPKTIETVRRTLQRLASNDDLRPVDGAKHLYEVTSPFAQRTPILEEEILMELHPAASLSYASALAFHQMSDFLPHGHFLTIPAGNLDPVLPLGTTENDWIGLAVIKGQMPKKIKNQAVHWHVTKDDKFVGFEIYYPNVYPVRASSPERTLIDAMSKPDMCGGANHVFNAWRNYLDLLNVEKMVRIVEQLDVAIVKQRIGFMMEYFEFSHPSFDKWASESKRGGSSKLIGHLPYLHTFSERWKMSINYSMESLWKTTIQNLFRKLLRGLPAVKRP